MAGKKMSPIRCTLEVGNNGRPLLSLSYAVKDRWGFDHRVEEMVPLLTTCPYFGGLRYWFSCPRLVGGKRCGRRVAKLYRPPGSWYFACRQCLDLTYVSCQKSHRYDGLFARMASETAGITPEVMEAIFTPSMSFQAHNRSIDQRLLRGFEKTFLK